MLTALIKLQVQLLERKLVKPRDTMQIDIIKFQWSWFERTEQRMKWLCRAEAMKDVKRQRVHFWMCPFHLLMELRRRYWYWIRHHFTSNSSSATRNDSDKYYYFVALLFSSQIANPFWLMDTIDFLFSISLSLSFFTVFPFAFASDVSITIMVYWTTQIQYSFVYSFSVWSMISAASPIKMTIMIIMIMI